MFDSCRMLRKRLSPSFRDRLLTPQISDLRSAKPRKTGRRMHRAARAHLHMETLEDRLVPSTLTGFTLVEQQGFPVMQTTVVSLPTILKDTFDQTWQKLVKGNQLIQGQTLQQLVTADIQQAAQQQSVSAYNISENFASLGSYSGNLDTSSANPTLRVQYFLASNTIDFTTTTNSPLGSYADPTFHVSFDMTIAENVTLPSNLSSQSTVTASATATISNVTVSSHNVLVALANLFGYNITQTMANQISGISPDLSGSVSASGLNMLLQAEAAKGFTRLIASLDGNGNLLLTALTPHLVINLQAGANTLDIDSDLQGDIRLALNGQTGQFGPGEISSITVNALGGSNTINVESLTNSVSLALNLSNRDVVNFSPNAQNQDVPAHDLDHIRGAVSISGTPTSLDVYLYDQDASAARTYGIDSSTVTLPDGDTIGIQHPVTSTTLWTAASANASNQVNVSPVSQNLDGIGQLSVHGGGNTTLQVNDQANPHGQTHYTLSSSSLRKLGPNTPATVFAGVSYDGLQNLQVNLGNTVNQVSVEGAPAGTTIYAGTGSNTVDVSSASQNLDGLEGETLTVEGAGNTVLNIYDQANNHAAVSGVANVYHVYADELDRSITPSRGASAVVSKIIYPRISGLHVWAAGSTNQILVSETYAPMDIHAGTSSDTITVGAPVQGEPFLPYGLGYVDKLTIDGHGGRLLLDDTGTQDSTSDPSDVITYTTSFTVTDQAVKYTDHSHEVQITYEYPGEGYSGPPRRFVTVTDLNSSSTITYSNLQSLGIIGGPVATTFNVQSTASGIPVTINAGKNDNPFNVGNNGSLKSVRSHVTLNGLGANALVLDDSQSTSQDRVTVTPTQVGAAANDHFFAAGGYLDYTGIDSVTLSLSHAANDTVQLTPSAAAAFFINGDPTEYQAGAGATLDLLLAGVTSPVKKSTAPGAGQWTFGNRQPVNFTNLAQVLTN